VENLDLHNNAISSLHRALVSGIKMENLTKLDLSGNGISLLTADRAAMPQKPVVDLAEMASKARSVSISQEHAIQRCSTIDPSWVRHDFVYLLDSARALVFQLCPLVRYATIRLPFKLSPCARFPALSVGTVRHDSVVLSILPESAHPLALMRLP
jgi:hypothetical protein